MPLIEFSMITGAIVEMAVEAGWDKVRKYQAVQQVLRKLGIDFAPPSADFHTVYVYTLVLFGLGKPQPVIEIFNQPRIYQLVQRAFETGDLSLVEKEARESIDWPVLEKVIDGLDVSPEPLIREFISCFDDAVDRARTAPEIRYERKVDRLISGQELLPQQVAQQLSPQFGEIKTLLLQNFSLEDTQSEKLSRERTYDAQIDQARDLIQEDRAGAAQSLLKKLEVEFQDRDISAGLWFRLLTNLGASFVVLGEDAQAVPYLA